MTQSEYEPDDDGVESIHGEDASLNVRAETAYVVDVAATWTELNITSSLAILADDLVTEALYGESGPEGKDLENPPACIGELDLRDPRVASVRQRYEAAKSAAHWSAPLFSWFWKRDANDTEALRDMAMLYFVIGTEASRVRISSVTDEDEEEGTAHFCVRTRCAMRAGAQLHELVGLLSDDKAAPHFESRFRGRALVGPLRLVSIAGDDEPNVVLTPIGPAGNCFVVTTTRDVDENEQLLCDFSDDAVLSVSGAATRTGDAQGEAPEAGEASTSARSSKRTRVRRTKK